jgi:hypothetical protein
MHMDYISFLVNSSINLIYVGIQAVHMMHTNNIFDSFSLLVFQILYMKNIFILIPA